MTLSSSPILTAFEHGEALRQRKRALNSPPSCNEQQHHADLIPTNPPAESTKKQTRTVQHVLTISQRAVIVRWMVAQSNTGGAKHLPSRAVTMFLRFFRGSDNANIAKASRLWKARSTYVERIDSNGRPTLRGLHSTICRRVPMGRARVDLKVCTGRGLKRAEWVEALHCTWIAEFDRLRKLGVKFDYGNLRSLGLYLMENSSNNQYHSKILDPRTKKELKFLITPRFTQSFADRYGIVAFHLGVLARQFRGGLVKEDDIENANETHFVIDMDNERTLGMSGESEVKYCDAVLGKKGMTMMVRISGGRDTKIHPPFMVFKNCNRSYPIRGVPDNVVGVSYRSGPQGWMDTKVIPEWLSESKVIRALLIGTKRVLYVDNCSGHNQTAEMLHAASKINTLIRYFDPNLTDYVQPCDSFVIQEIKSAWSVEWEKYKMQMIMQNKWTDKSGKIPNPGKKIFLELAVESVNAVNKQRDADGVSYARKAMMMTGMALNLNGQWKERQLMPKLQQIVNKYRVHFEGEPVKFD